MSSSSLRLVIDSGFELFFEDCRKTGFKLDGFTEERREEE